MISSGAFKAVPVTDNVFWVGAVDWSVRDFHGYSTSRGTTYNAYLIKTDKITLVDTVKATFRDEMLSRVASVVDPASIDVIISNHAEPDHSGELAETIREVQPEVVYASKSGKRALEEHYGIGATITEVAEGQELDLGGEKVVFAETKMCHWPDSMVTYMPSQELLISQDAFGMHLASYERFNDQIDSGVLWYEAAKYYANILLPLSNFVSRTLQKVEDLGLKISIIAPDHGPIWRQEPSKIVQWYAQWARQERNNKAIVLYDTMWKSTEKMAKAVGEGLGAGGAHPTVMALSGSHRSDVATRLLDSGGLLVGAPTLNNELFPRIADVLTYVKGLRPEGLVGAAFGSFGWSGESIKKLNEMLTDMGVEVVADPVRSRYVPKADVLEECYGLGQAVAQRLAQNQPAVSG